MHEVPVWREGRAHKSLESRLLQSYRGEDLARIHTTPALLIHRVVEQLRRAAPGPGEALEERCAAIERAGERLATDELGGLSPSEHARQVTLATGAPIADTTAALAELAAGMRAIRSALSRQVPGGDLSPFATHRVRHPGGWSHAWVPVGQVLGFIAPSNHPAVHLTWVQALAMGWSVALRPGADDPFTPWRLLLALEAAGFPTDRIALLPGGHDLVPALVGACDRTVAYGGPVLATLLAENPRVLFNGPGHSKVFVDLPLAEGVAVADLADFLVDCIASDGGRKCTCASALLLRGGQGDAAADPLIAAVQDRLAALPLLDPLDPAARVPAWKAQVPSYATAVQRDGLRFVQPELRRCADPAAPPFGAEIPAPWATVASTTDPLRHLRGSLAVTLLTPDDGLVESCLVDPSILKVFAGPVPPWFTQPGAPHHGRLADFLFTAKAHRKEANPWC